MSLSFSITGQSETVYLNGSDILHFTAGADLLAGDAVTITGDLTVDKPTTISSLLGSVLVDVSSGDQASVAVRGVRAAYPAADTSAGESIALSATAGKVEPDTTFYNNLCIQGATLLSGDQVYYI